MMWNVDYPYFMTINMYWDVQAYNVKFNFTGGSIYSRLLYGNFNH